MQESRLSSPAQSAPTLQQTPGWGSGSHPQRARSKAAEIILDGIEQDRCRVLAGSDVAFLGRFYRLSPQRAANFIFK